jgi:hypothetical protein
MFWDALLCCMSLRGACIYLSGIRAIRFLAPSLRTAERRDYATCAWAFFAKQYYLAALPNSTQDHIIQLVLKGKFD